MDQNPETPKQDFDPDWAKNLVKELKESFSQIGDSLEKAWKEGKNEPKLKKFGEDMKETFRKIPQDIEDLFK